MTASGAIPPLDVYEIAVLAGGPWRAVDAALVALVQSGRVRVHEPGVLTTVAMWRRHALEAAVLDAVGPAGHRSIDTVQWRLTVDQRLLDLGRRLRRDALLAPWSRLAHHPADHHRADHHPALTRAGHRVLAQLQASPPADHVAPETDAMSVALGGRKRLPDRALYAAVFEGVREAGRFGRGSHSAHPLEAAAEARQQVQATPQVIHGSGHELFVPVGPQAPALHPRRRGR